MRIEKGGGAWCPRPAIQHNVREWIEVALPGHIHHQPHLVVASETQGRFGNGQGQEFAEAFIIEYWRHEIGRWVTYKSATGHQILSGNTNPWLAAMQQLDHPIVAERIRFLPYSHHPRTTCMRVEVYGCPWTGKNKNIVIYHRHIYPVPSRHTLQLFIHSLTKNKRWTSELQDELTPHSQHYGPPVATGLGRKLGRYLVRWFPASRSTSSGFDGGWSWPTHRWRLQRQPDDQQRFILR